MIISSHVDTQSPEERCANDPSLPLVCYNCLQTYDCQSTTITNCGTSSVCDASWADGFCVPPFSIPDTCQCTSAGCMQDPFNSDTVLDCRAGNEYPEAIITCPAGQVPDPETCNCLAGPKCPECGFISADINESCEQEFTFCGSDPDTITGIDLECPNDLCYDETTCECVAFCPDCGLVLDTKGDGSFCFCDKAQPTCGLFCDDGENFDSTTCKCVDISTTIAVTTAPEDTTTATEVIPTTPEDTTPTMPCNECGLSNGSADDCSEYYACDPLSGERDDGPYYCPGNYCFDYDTCSCV